MNWTEIATACEKATGPDREIDAAIAKALGWTRFMFGGGGLVWKDETGEIKAAQPRYTASLDAITALIKRELPDRSMSSFWSATKSMSARAHLWRVGIEQETAGNAATEPLARCAAFARAMSQKETENGNL